MDRATQRGCYAGGCWEDEQFQPQVNHAAAVSNGGTCPLRELRQLISDEERMNAKAVTIFSSAPLAFSVGSLPLEGPRQMCISVPILPPIWL